jgi:dTDP-D-glucose 4,6-dehydratase
MKTVVCSGAWGSIGHHVIKTILEKTDWNIVAIDSFRHKGYRERIINDPRVKTIQTDLVCPISEKMREEIGKVDYIIHLAAMSDVFFSVENPAYVIKNNIDSTLTMLEYARVTPHKMFIYFSTDEVYGPVKKGEAHNEWDMHRPSNPYAASKAACEDICYSYWRSGLPIVITNTMNNFGTMQSHSKFPVIIQNKVEKGEVVEIHGSEKEVGTRFYIHSKRVADSLLDIIKKGAYMHRVGELDEPDRYHIAGKKCLSNLELARTIANLMGKPLKYKYVPFHDFNPAHDIHYGLNNNKLVINDDFESDMKEVIEWQQKNPEWM